MPDMVDMLKQPVRMPLFGAALARDIDAALASETPVTGAIAAAAVRRGQAVETCDDPAWYLASANDSKPLARALADVGAPPADVSGVPRELQAALAPIVRALASTSRDVTAARKVDGQTQAALATVPTWMIGVRHFEMTRDIVDAMNKVDVDAIAQAGVRIAGVVERAKLWRFANASVADVTFATPFGAIVLRGPANHTYEAGNAADGAAFVLDTGGNDTYHVALGASSVARPISIAVDLGGNDTYAYAEAPVAADKIGRRMPSDGAGRAADGRTLSRTPRQGAGVLGVGLLFDLGTGADSYRSLVGSQGVGTHGVGVLYDEAGDDTYAAEGFAQGAAAWGVGLLIDRAGSDQRTLYTQGQGFGFTRGLGAIVDAAGDDRYVAFAGSWEGAPAALASDALYPSAQLPGPPTSRVTGNSSFAQGCGAGHRPDWPDAGFPSPGGTGVLYDLAGNDTYGAGVFAQGCGFVQGFGVLVDRAGADTYDALYYAQGAAVHMGLALFDEGAGDDHYDGNVPVEAAALGLAHDLSSAVHFDGAGNDTYSAPALSLGTAEDNGLGLLVNTGGSDLFSAASSWSLGDALTSEINDERRRVQTVAVFVKAGGDARYRVGSKKEETRSGKSWGSSKQAEKSAGVDRPKATASLR